MVDVSARRSQIASLITSDIERKREQKKRQTTADLLKAKMGIGGRKEVAQIQQTGAMEREKAGQTGATYRANIAAAADKAIQAMRGKQAMGVQTLRGKQAVSLQDIKGGQAEDLIEREAFYKGKLAEEESEREISQTKSILATIPTMDVEEYEFTPEGTQKKKKDSQRLLMP